MEQTLSHIAIWFRIHFSVIKPFEMARLCWTTTSASFKTSIIVRVYEAAENVFASYLPSLLEGTHSSVQREA